MKTALLNKQKQLKDLLEKLKASTNLTEQWRTRIAKLEQQLNEIEQQINAESDPEVITYEENIKTEHWYTDEDINTILQARVKDFGGYAKDKTFLLRGIGNGDDYLEDVEKEVHYKVLLTGAGDTHEASKPITFFFDREQQPSPDIEKRDDRRDIFDELSPLLLDNEEINIKILFPYNYTNHHWTLAEIKIHKTNHKYLIDVCVHDPIGSGQMDTDNYDKVYECFMRKICDIDAYADVHINYKVSPYQMRRQAENDGSSCGVIVIEELFIRITGGHLTKSYPVGAEALRKKHLDDLKASYLNDKNNLTLKNFIARNVKKETKTEADINHNLLKLQEKLNEAEKEINNLDEVIKQISQQPQQSSSSSHSQTSSNSAEESSATVNREITLILQRKKLLYEMLNGLKNAVQTNIADHELKVALLEKITKILNNIEDINPTSFKSNMDEKPTEYLVAKTKNVRELLVRLRDHKIANQKSGKAYEAITEEIKAWLVPTLNQLIEWATLSVVKPGELPPTEKQLKQIELLKEQQKVAIACPDFYQALRAIHKLATGKGNKKTDKGNTKTDDGNKKSVFISYAWPSKERESYEGWVQEFLLYLKKHLEDAHLRVMLDLTNSRDGFNSYKHMNEILECDYVILIGTESLIDKHRVGISAVCNELNNIREKRVSDEKQGLFRVIPLVISGDIDKALPIEYMRYTVIESFYQTSYVSTVFQLLGKILGYEKNENFLSILNAYQQKYPKTFNTLSPFANISSQHRPDLQEELQATPRQTVTTDNTGNVPYHVKLISADKNPLQNLLSKLKDGYRQTANEMRLLFNQKKLSLKDHYINLALVEQKEVEDKSTQQSEIALDCSIHGLNQWQKNKKSIEKKKLSLPKLFDQYEAKDGLQQIAIYGGAGIGKSTLCQHIAYQWSTDQLWQDKFSAIFWIKLRDLADSRLQEAKTLADLLERLCFNIDLTDEERKQLQTLTAEKIDKPFLIVLDGYDETPQSILTEDRSAFRKPLDMLFVNTHVLLTSRPQVINGLNQEHYVEILGLEHEQIESYVDKFFKEQIGKAVNLKKYLQQNSLAGSLAEIPLNLELICSVWQDEKLSEDLSLTELYQRITRYISKRYLAKFKTQFVKNITPKLIEQHCADWLTQLEKLAWQMFSGEVDKTTAEAQIKIYFDTNLLTNIIHEDEQFPAKVDLLLDQCGFLRRLAGKEGSEAMEGEFIHLTFQEFFAARHVARIIQSAGSQGKAEYEAFQIFFKENKFNPKLQVVWWFIAGLLKDDSKALDKYFLLLLQEPRDILVINELPLFMHCLEQSNLAENSRVGKRVLNKVTERILFLLNGGRTNSTYDYYLFQQVKLCPKFFSNKGSDNSKIEIGSVFKSINNYDPRGSITADDMQIQKSTRHFREIIIDDEIQIKGNTFEEIIYNLFRTLDAENDDIVYIAPTALENICEKLKIGKLEAIKRLTEFLTQHLEQKPYYYVFSYEHQTILAIKFLVALSKHDQNIEFKKIVNTLIWALYADNDVIQLEAINALSDLANHAELNECKEIVNALCDLLQDKNDDIEYSNVPIAAVNLLRRLAKTYGVELGKIKKTLFFVLDDNDYFNDVKVKSIAALELLAKNTKDDDFKEIVDKLRTVLIGALSKSDTDLGAMTLAALDKLIGAHEFVKFIVEDEKFFLANSRYLFTHTFIDKHKALTLKDNQLKWFERNQGMVSVNLPREIASGLKNLLLKKPKSIGFQPFPLFEEKITPFLWPRHTLIETPLMQAASHGDLQKVETLLAHGADTRCVDELGKMAVGYAQNIDVLELLIERHQPIDMDFLNSCLIMLDAYRGENDAEDQMILNNLVKALTGNTDNNNFFKKREKLSKKMNAHFQNFGSTRTKDNQVIKELEGFSPKDFLELHIINLLEILANIQLNILDYKHTKLSKEEIISYLKKELLVTVQASHFSTLAELLNKAQTHEQKLRLEHALAKAILSAVSRLSDKEELIFQTGYIDPASAHCVYVAMRRDGEKLVVRVDNLGAFCDRHLIDQANKRYPYFITTELFSRVQEENTDFMRYLQNVIAALWKTSNEFQKGVYNGNTINPYYSFWSAKKQQTVGNCVIRSFLVGAQMRLWQTEIGKEKVLYKLFLNWEIFILNEAGSNKNINNQTRLDSQSSTTSEYRPR